MLSNKDLHTEIKAMDEIITKLDSPFESALLKAATLILKLLHNVRSNQVIIMKESGINLLESKPLDKDNKEKEATTE